MCDKNQSYEHFFIVNKYFQGALKFLVTGLLPTHHTSARPAYDAYSTIIYKNVDEFSDRPPIHMGGVRFWTVNLFQKADRKSARYRLWLYTIYYYALYENGEWLCSYMGFSRCRNVYLIPIFSAFLVVWFFLPINIHAKLL